MALKKLRLINFRNHEFLNLHFQNGITVFTGANGAGKTSILESVAIIASSKSFRAGKNEDLILRGADKAKIEAELYTQGLDNSVDIEIRKNGKSVLLNKKNVRKIRSLIELLPYVAFSPGDHKIIDGDSSDRKNFINKAFSFLDFDYADVLSDYNRVLLQRNQLLKRFSNEVNGWASCKSQIEVWDDQLVTIGFRLMELRHKYSEALQPKIENEYFRIASKNEKFELRYAPLTENGGFLGEKTKEEFASALKDSLRRDYSTGTTNLGPHKDEIILILNGNKVKFYGSQGEKRTCVLALRLGEVSLFKEKFKKSPVLLIDDVSSELDSERRKALVELLRQEDEQVLITATELPADLMNKLERPYVHCDLKKFREGTA